MADRFLNVDRSGFGVDVTIAGLTELEKGLRSFDPQLARTMNAAIRAAIDPVVQAARGYVPDVALSGWDNAGTGVWSTRLGWDAAAVRKGIRIRKGSLRRKRYGTSVAWRIQQMDAAGAVFELAGKKNPGSDFATALTRKHGRASRVIWRAWDDRGDEVEPKIRAAVAAGEAALQRAVDTGAG